MPAIDSAEYHARLDCLGALYHVVHVVSDVMRTAVPHISADIVHRIQHARVLEQRGVIAAYRRINVLHAHTGLNYREHVVGGGKHAFVQYALLFGEMAVAGPAARNVGYHAVVLCTHVVKYHVAVLSLAGVAVIMNAEVIAPRGYDRRETVAFRAVLPQRVIEVGLVLIFVLARTGMAHHVQYTGFGYLLGAAQGFDFAGLLY